MRLLCVLLMSLLGQAAMAEVHDCFTVVDPRGEVVYKSNRSPVDLSKRISEAMAAYPGHHLVWSRSDDACSGVDRLPARDIATAAAPAATPAAGDTPAGRTLVAAANGQGRRGAARGR